MGSPLLWLHPHAQWSDAVLALALGAWLASLVAERRRLGDPLLLAACAAYVGWGLVSWAMAQRDGASLARVLGMAALALLLLATADLARAPAVRRWIARATVASALLCGALALLGVFWWWLGEPTVLVGDFGDLAPGRYVRVRALASHPNALASFLVFAAAMAALRGAELRGLARAAADAVLAVTALLTFSRSILTFALVLFLRGPERARRRGSVALSVAAVAVALAFLTFVRIDVDPTRPWLAEVAQGRATREQNLVSAWDAFLAHPLFGAGPGAVVARADGISFEAHMTALNVAATMGLPALVAFAAIVRAACPAPRVAGREPDVPMAGRAGGGPRDPALVAALFAFALDSLAGDVEDFRHLWVLLGLAASDGAKVPEEVMRVTSSP